MDIQNDQPTAGRWSTTTAAYVEPISRHRRGGLTNQEVADKLFISLRTVETHRLNLAQKIGAKNTAGLVKEAIRMELID